MSIVKLPDRSEDGFELSSVTRFTGEDAKAEMAKTGHIGPEFGELLDSVGLDFEIESHHRSRVRDNTMYGDVRADLKVFPKGMDPDAPDTPYIVVDTAWEWDTTAMHIASYLERGMDRDDWIKDERNGKAIAGMCEGLSAKYGKILDGISAARRQAEREEAERRDREISEKAASLAGKAYDLTLKDVRLVCPIERKEDSESAKALFGILADAYVDNMAYDEDDDYEDNPFDGRDPYEEHYMRIGECFEEFESDIAYSGVRDNMHKAAAEFADRIPEGKSLIAFYPSASSYSSKCYMIVDSSAISMGDDGRTATVRLSGYGAEIVEADGSYEEFETKKVGEGFFWEIMKDRLSLAGVEIVGDISAAGKEKASDRARAQYGASLAGSGRAYAERTFAELSAIVNGSGESDDRDLGDE